MNGVHDMGGMDGFGRVEPEPNEPVFHHRWEGRVLAMSRAIGFFRQWTIDMSRYVVESLAPAVYLTSSYYERWFLRNLRLLVEHGFIDEDEVAAGRALRPGKELPRGRFTAADVERVVRRGSYGRPAPAPVRFKVGDRVRARNIHPTTHTRLPRYARGHVGVVERVHGAHVFPDSVVAGRGEDPQWLYTVRFDGRELWGEDADPKLKVSIEAFEPYLEHA
ncbi:MAG TPA: nitrile hydratase subunit beta [candidate division Zixibacteria bacterium]|nr:nitrile hydratase subunit beta [candidate division Zixibacteria bacterium]